ncbi:MAG: hypothetical protein ACXWN4_06470 [Candidatus Limnocylindrales bacterium]
MDLDSLGLAVKVLVEGHHVRCPQRLAQLCDERQTCVGTTSTGSRSIAVKDTFKS